MPANIQGVNQANWWEVDYELLRGYFEKMHKPLFPIAVNPVKQIFIMDDYDGDDLDEPLDDDFDLYGAKHHERTQEYIKELQEDYPFQLAGSRYFAQRAIAEGRGEKYINIEDDTDYDLFIEHGENVCIWLVSKGFEQIQMEQYGGKYTKALLTHPDYPLIQITTRLRADAYKKAIDTMPVHIYREYGWKRGPNNLTRELIQEHFENWTDWAVIEIDQGL